MQVNKQWIVNGVTFADGPAAAGLSAQLDHQRRPPAPFGVVVAGFTAGQTVAINETVTNTLPLCTVTSQR